MAASKGAVAFVGDSLSVEAGADLSAKQYRFVKLDTAGKVIVPTASTDRLLGILQNKPASGAMALVKIVGGSKLVVDAGTDVVAADQLTAESGGDGIKTTTATHVVRAFALEGATNDGEIISVMLVGPYVLP